MRRRERRTARGRMIREARRSAGGRAVVTTQYFTHALLISGEMVKIKTRIRNRNRGKKSYIGFDRRKEIEDFGLVSSFLISLLLFVLVFFGWPSILFFFVV